LLGILLLLASYTTAYAISGSILSLTATDGPSQGDTIDIASSVRADDSINSSNLYYQIIAPDGVTIVATHTTSVPTLSAGNTFSDGWSTSNSGWPSTGTYTVELCWSPGNSQNCSIASASTTFYSVPTLGWGLSLLGLGLVSVWIWKQRHRFEVSTA
jgi:hypothetical protein